MRSLAAILLLLTSFAGGIHAAEPAVRLQVSLAGDPPTALGGEVVQWDDRSLVLRVGDEQRTIRWIEIEPLSAFRARSRLIDREDASQWLELGAMGWSMGLEEASAEAIARAIRLDPELAAQEPAIRAKPAGWALPHPPKGDAPAVSGNQPPSAEYNRPRNFIEYAPSTPEQDAAAINVARRRTTDVENRLGIKLAEFQTPHFIVFTDWDPREYRFLETNLEAAYRAVAKVFDYDPKQNIFEGKLAIYMFARRDDFVRFGKTFSGMPEVPDRMAGYFAWRGQIIYMAMWKPDMSEPGVTKRVAELKWAYVLAHEFVHAFTYRYQTNVTPPLWANEGLAETVAMDMFPMMSDYSLARRMAATTPSLLPMFSDPALQRDFNYYSVHRTLIETLITRDRKAFIAWFNDIKYGMDAEEALKKHFNWDYPTLERMWRRYVAAVR